MSCIEVTIRGRVQGVGFRQFTVEQARRLGVFGWVRNDEDGAVRVRACGDDDVLRVFVRSLQSGPPLARVDTFEAKAVKPPDTSFEDFEIQH